MRMRVLLKLLFVITFSFLLTSCATTGLKFTELAPSVSNLTTDMGRIYIYRTSVFGTVIQPEVKLNGEVIGKAVPKGFFYVDKKPGNYVITTSTEVTGILSFTLNEGQTRYVRLNVSMGLFVGHVYPELVDPQVAEKEIKDCRYVGGKSN